MTRSSHVKIIRVTRNFLHNNTTKDYFLQYFIMQGITNNSKHYADFQHSSVVDDLDGSMVLVLIVQGYP